jgi:hypothetical protein
VLGFNATKIKVQSDKAIHIMSADTAGKNADGKFEDAPESDKTLNLVGVKASNSKFINKNIETTGMDVSGKDADKKFKAVVEDYKTTNVTGVDGSNSTFEGGDIKVTGIKF